MLLIDDMATTNEGQTPDSQECKDFVQVSSNWNVKIERNLRNTVSIISLSNAPNRVSLDEVVSFETCVPLCPSSLESEPCIIDIKLTNSQRIKRIAVVSEATVLEFFKQFGEYANTVFAEFVDEFEDQSVYIGEVTIEPPTSETSIKFTKTKRKRPEMWLYGIKLVVIDSKPETSQGLFDLEVIDDWLSNSKVINPEKAQTARKMLNSFSMQDVGFPGLETCLGKIASSPRQESVKLDMNMQQYVDNKIQEVEHTLTKKLQEMEEGIHQKLDTILTLLKTRD